MNRAAAAPAQQSLAALVSRDDGLTAAEAADRRISAGPNSIGSHHAEALSVLARQLRSPLLLLLAATAIASFLLGEHTDAVIIGIILSASVGLGFVNEYRAERASEALHQQIRHQAVVIRDGRRSTVDVSDLVPGDVVVLQLGEVVPADIRLMSATKLECDESVLTGESSPVEKNPNPVAAGTSPAELTNCALMGTVVSSGTGVGIVVATGGRTEFGRIATGLGHKQPETEFQIGLRQFSMLLVKVAAVLTVGIFAVNLLLSRPLIDALLFSLAIAVGISPQLLPAVVSTSLAAGSRQLAHRKVLVKRLVCIEDLGNVQVLFTDKTGTLTEGRIEYLRALSPDGAADDEPALLGLVCTDATIDNDRVVGGNQLDTALWAAPIATHAAATTYDRLSTVPFDHERRLVSVLARGPHGQRLIITKGAPESVLARCAAVPDGVAAVLAAEFAAGHRVIAVATKDADNRDIITAEDEHEMRLRGILVFLDPPKPTAKKALARLARLGVDVKIITGDNPIVAANICAELGLSAGEPLTGSQIELLDDTQLAARIATTTVFARVGPEQKQRIVRAQRTAGKDVGFLGDGVNDALALHAADIGISVDTGADVAKDSADVILLEKDLQVLADGVVEGRRIFANTIKYVLMGTSSNFGNMFSAAGASALLSFLPMLPSQILLNNLLYDTSQLAIPTDNVDEEQLARPSHWNIGLIRRFMLVFGPVSSVFDFATFGVMLWIFHAGAPLFRTGWFVESLATQTLVLFVIRTRRSPFTRSLPSVQLTLATLSVVAIGVVLPMTPVAGTLGFHQLPGMFFLALTLMVLAYLVLAELVKRRFFRAPHPPTPPLRDPHLKRLRRRAARFNTRANPAAGPVPHP